MKLSLLTGIILFPLLGFSQFDRAKTQEWLNEVFRDCSEYVTDAMIDDHMALANRYQYVHDPSMKAEDVTSNLNQYQLKNKCNMDLTREVSSAVAINPFKYFVDFYVKERQVIKVGNSDYYLIIAPY